MKTRIVCLVFCFYFVNVPCGHGQRIFYQVKGVYRLDYQPDSTDTQNRASENMILLINGVHSIFKSYNHILSDSAEWAVMQSPRKTLSISLKNRTNFSYSIIKDSSDMLVFRDNIFFDHFEYAENKHLSWKILEDTVTIHGYSCQKAVTEYAGRKWTAWFSNQVPISEGPYKFNGLPGLIFKVTDSKNHYDFELVELMKQDGSVYQPDIKFIKVTKGKYYASLSDFIENRYEIVSASTNITRGEENIRSRMNEARKKNNNPIELHP